MRPIAPLVELFQIVLRWRDEEEDLLALDDIVPDRGAAKINVEVIVAACRSHEEIAFDSGVVALVAVALRPQMLNPVNLAHEARPSDVLRQLGRRELERDDIQLQQ